MEQNRFKTKDWDRLKVNIEGFKGELHHACGKGYEYLSLLKLMTPEDHRGGGHNKCMNPDRYPCKDQEDNMRFWKDNLHEDDWEYFFTEGIAWPKR